MPEAAVPVGEYPPHAATQLLTAVSIGILQLGIAISLAALVFSESLAPGAGRAAVGFVLGTGIVSAVVGLTTRMPVAVAGSQDTAAIVMAAVAASLAASTTAEGALPTVVVMVALCALVTGLAFWFLGAKSKTSFVRYLPWPVITGFTAGTGWLLLRGGVEVMHGAGIEFTELPDLFVWDQAKLILPGLAFAFFLVAVLRSRITNVVVSALFLVAIGAFHLVGRSVSSIEQLEADGWLFGPFPTDASWKPVSPSDVADADWGALLGHALPIVAVVAVAIVGLLLNLSGLEPILDAEIDMDTEVRSTGLANLAVGFTGGLVGWHLIGDTALAKRLGARGRTVPITVAVMSLGVLALGPGPIGMIPRMVAGGVLSMLGISLLIDWAQTTMPRLSRTDRWLSGGILAAIAILGVLPGVALGVLVATAVFLTRYSRIDPARHVINAAGRSNVDRSESERSFLLANATAVLAIELHGFLFFGSTMRLREMLQARGLDDPERAAITEFLVVDMERVTGLDSTAAAGLAGLASRLAAQGTVTVWSSIDEEMATELHINGVDLGPLHSDLDHAIAWCEDQLLTDMDAVGLEATSAAMSPELRAEMDIRSLAPRTALIQAGDDDRDLYFVESGLLTAWVMSGGGRRTRLRQVTAGAVLGEVAFCRGGLRTADVITDTDATILVLTRQHFDALTHERPELAVELQDLLLGRLADRVADTSAMVRDLLR